MDQLDKRQGKLILHLRKFTFFIEDFLWLEITWNWIETQHILDENKISGSEGEWFCTFVRICTDRLNKSLTKQKQREQNNIGVKIGFQWINMFYYSEQFFQQFNTTTGRFFITQNQSFGNILSLLISYLHCLHQTLNLVNPLSFDSSRSIRFNFHWVSFITSRRAKHSLESYLKIFVTQRVEYWVQSGIEITTPGKGKPHFKQDLEQSVDGYFNI